MKTDKNQDQVKAGIRKQEILVNQGNPGQMKKMSSQDIGEVTGSMLFHMWQRDRAFHGAGAMVGKGPFGLTSLVFCWVGSHE